MVSGLLVFVLAAAPATSPVPVALVLTAGQQSVKAEYTLARARAQLPKAFGPDS